MHSQQSQQTPGMSHGDAVNLFYRVLTVLATCIIPLIRNGFGVEFPGMNGLLATLLLIVVAPSVPDMDGYFYLWFFALVIQRINTLRNARRGVVVHSRYDGYPFLAMKMPFVRSESAAKQIAEPLICLTLGGVIYTVSPLFGQCIMVIAASLFLKCLVENVIHAKRIQRMRDAEIEQRWYSEQFRKGMK